MKTKPILVIIALIASIVFIRCKGQSNAETGDITHFLNAFNAQLKAGNADSASNYFEVGRDSKAVKILLGVLANKTNLGKGKPLFKVTLNTDDGRIKGINNDFAEATVTATFSYDGMPAVKSVIILTIHKAAGKQYKISAVNAGGFVKGYMAYQTKVINKTVPEKDIFDPITLAAFKTAGQLKARYDSVLWFEHINNKSFFYVVKNIDERVSWVYENETGKIPTHTMGLVNPGLKEIIPPEYDLIHNIGGTIEGLIEVEKGSKRGFYDLQGKLVVPVIYDQLYPLKDNENLALLKINGDFFYLKKDLTVTDKLADFKIADVLPQIKAYGKSFDLSDKSSKNIMEYNDRESTNCVVIPPSYLVDWQILSKVIDFQNPLRKNVQSMNDDGEGDVSISISFEGAKNKDESWFQSAFYSIIGEYLGARGGLYTNKNLLIVDKKQNRIMGFRAGTYYGGAESGGNLSGNCNENSLKAINDSLFEFKTTSEFDQGLLNDGTIIEGPYFHYLQVKNGKLVNLPSKRLFPTQYVKLDDSYLEGCFVLGDGGSDAYHPVNKKSIDHVTVSMLQYMKNEIFASYLYKFKNPQWENVFGQRFYDANGTQNANVDDSLTVIDKYNLNFINSKLNAKKANSLAVN